MDYRKYEPERRIFHWLTVPIVWLPLPFILILDLVIMLYQVLCFPIYKIERVKRSEYILVMDRNKLDYLYGLEKLGCMYCGYANGVFRYIKEVAGRTEKYWCGVMHEDKPGFKIQEDQVIKKFAKFGDEADFNEKYKKI
ncbi:hypothetical protein COT94_02635 [Candidatus Falkowbacteria bacterium CG10_big_fil_rev_8_21_14_0_10_37_14]|uniref:Uncharacterized protein n=1 Tax=Candidatus Falkowbacteria bacterium CG10_big_fil_rev_8_21_14_0_10_37_14 TaxID=1974561 RepID=A0A2M6WTK7_9BACT|nr:hypothetical protein [Candidatus Falkowbacteria bacterium]PIT96129.1 MAG: hypothetical protein COT94_02635 [Candidatus Falkowbacteria bacterium CG10_big_fil_rev_8_21_14_0_10_37_14]